MATETSRPASFDPGMVSSERAPDRVPGWDPGTERRLNDGETLARMLGWFSLGLGALELLAPDRLAEFLGMEDRERLLQFYGAREAAVGVGILAERKPEGWIWARVAGDFLDLATLAAGLTSRNPHRDRVLMAMAAVAGVTALDIICVRQLDAAKNRARDLRGSSNQTRGSTFRSGAFE